MSTARFNAYLKKISPGDRVRRAVSAARLNSLGTLAKEAASGTFISGGPGVRMQHGPNGCTISVKRSTQRGGRPFPLTARSYGTGWIVKPGNCNGVAVTAADGTPLSDDPPPVGTHLNGKIYLEIIFNVKFSNEYCRRATFVSAKVKADDEIPENTHEEIVADTFGEWIWNIELATLVDGQPSGNTFTSSVWAVVEDAYDAADEANCELRLMRA